MLNGYLLGKLSSGTPGMIYAVRELNMNWISKEGCMQHLAHVKVHRHPRAMYAPHSVHKDNITCRGTFARDSSRNVSHHWARIRHAPDVSISKLVQRGECKMN